MPRDSSWPAVMEGGGERKCGVCNVRVPMANCGAGWCWPCYWHCAGKPAAALHTSKCAVYHCAPAAPAQLACPPCTGAAAVGIQQGEVAVSVAEKYSAALREAGLEAGRVVVFAHAQQLVFAGLEDDCRRAPAARRAGKMVVSGWVKPAVVRFVERGKRFVVACGCAGEEHCGALLDIFAAEAEVAACGGEGAGRGPGPGSAFHSMLVQQAGVGDAPEVQAGACVHMCYAQHALQAAARAGVPLPSEHAVPLVGSPLGMVVAAGGGKGNWCVFDVANRQQYEQPLTAHRDRSGSPWPPTAAKAMHSGRKKRARGRRSLRESVARVVQSLLALATAAGHQQMRAAASSLCTLQHGRPMPLVSLRVLRHLVFTWRGGSLG